MFLNSKKVIYHAQALMMFLSISKDAKSLPVDFVEKAQEKCIQIQEQALKDTRKAVEQFNEIVQEMNQILSAPYPNLINDSEENILKGEITAFEHFLNQELKANRLTIQQEAPLFNESLFLWESIGISMSSAEGASAFSLLIGRLNSFLPDEQKYPFPD